MRRQLDLLEFLEFQAGTGRCRSSAMNTPQQSWQRSDGLQVRISLYCHMSADYKVMWLSLSLAWLHRPGSSDPSDFGKSRSPVCIYCWQNLCSQQYVKILLGTLKHIRFFLNLPLVFVHRIHGMFSRHSNSVCNCFFTRYCSYEMFKICIFLNIGITANEGNLNDF